MGKARLLAVAGIAIGLAGSCGGEDDPMTNAFAGTWTYAGALTPNCGATPVDPLDLTGSSVVITPTGERSLEVVLAGTCTVDFSVSGSTATALPNQSCTFEVPTLGEASVAITSWTLTINGDSIASSFSGGVFFCTVTGNGTLTK